MCTVTLIPLSNNNFILGSNRDEAPNRIALLPQFYNYKNINLLYPKDKQSEGSWIGLSERKRLICLLNGAFKIHKRQEKYRHSRGIVVKDFLVAPKLKNAIEDYNLKDIEPFTLVIVDWEDGLEFFEFVWDGEQKHFKQLPLEPRIWSSSTLYNDAMKIERQEWFNDFISNNEINSDSMFVFHSSTEKNNKDYGVVMDRGFVKTTSIARVEKENNDVIMRYYDLHEDSHHSKYLNKETPVKYEK